MTAIRIGSLMRRDALIASSYRMVFVLDILFGVVELAFYYFISATFAHVSPGDLGEAPSYFAFAIVGVLLGAVLNATSSTVGSRVRDEQLTGTLEILAASPLNSFELCVGLVSFPFLFALVRLGIYTIFALTVLGLELPSADWPGFLLVLLTTGAAIAPIGILAGAAALVVKRGHVVASTGVYLMTFLAGMAFPISVLPGWIRWISDLIPLRYAFDGARAALFTGGGWGMDVVVLSAIAAALWPSALVAFSWALTFAKRKAALADY